MLLGVGGDRRKVRDGGDWHGVAVRRLYARLMTVNARSLATPPAANAYA